MGPGFDGISKRKNSQPSQPERLLPLTSLQARGCWKPCPKGVWGTGFLVHQQDGTPPAFLGTRVPRPRKCGSNLFLLRGNRGEHRQTVRTSGISEQKVVSLTRAI